MKVDIRDRDALRAIAPDALSAYARAAGWSKTNESYGAHSDVYAAKGMPEIILPRTQRLGDYASVVAQLIDIFTKVAERDELALYHDLVNANRDVVRVRAGGSDDGTLTVNDGVDLIDGARGMLLAAACSLREPQALYRAGANKEAAELLSRVRMGQTEQGSFVVALVISIPPIPTLFGDSEDYDAPIERRMTKRLVEALGAVRSVMESAISGDDGALSDAVEKGVSANLCEALDRMIKPFPTLDVGVTWAQTRPMKSAGQIVRFDNADAPILREAARSFRKREPQPDICLTGPIHRLRRDEWESDGVVTMRTFIDGQWKSIKVYAKRADYDRLTEAHRERSQVVMRGDLEQHRQRLSLRNARIISVS